MNTRVHTSTCERGVGVNEQTVEQMLKEAEIGWVVCLLKWGWGWGGYNEEMIAKHEC